MISTEYVINNKPISYEILENGYNIHLDGKVWINQIEPLIPFKDLSYEEGCLKQLQQIVNQSNEIQVPSTDDMLVDLLIQSL